MRDEPDELRRIARLLEQQAIAALAADRAQEAALAAQASELSTLESRARAEEGWNTARRVAVADQAWQEWLGRRRAALNIELARRRARLLETEIRAARAIGRKEALLHLASEADKAERHRRENDSMADRLELYVLADAAQRKSDQAG